MQSVTDAVPCSKRHKQAKQLRTWT